MTNIKLNQDEKQAELEKYCNLVLATIDYYLDRKIMILKTADFDSIEYYKELKRQAEEHFKKGRLTRLKQWFFDLTEILIETRDLKFTKYLQDKTNYDIDIFQSYFQRVDKLIAKGKITTNNQFYEVEIMVDQLCHIEPIDNKKIETLNKLLCDYEQRKSRQTKKPNR